jgi:hypothetical protein
MANSSREGSVPGAAREVNWILGHKGPYWAILRDDGGFRQRNHAAGTGQREGVVVKDNCMYISGYLDMDM